jgi:hypothetical protein
LKVYGNLEVVETVINKIACDGNEAPYDAIKNVAIENYNISIEIIDKSTQRIKIKGFKDYKQ